MVPGFDVVIPVSSLLAFELLMSCGPCSNAKSVVLLYLRKNNSFSLNWKLICDSNDDFWLVGIYRDRD